MRNVCRTLNLADAGSGVHAVNSTHLAVPGTIEQNTTAIATANGVCVPPTKCVARLPYTHSSGRQRYLVLRDALILPNSEHNLISVGRFGASGRV